MAILLDGKKLAAELRQELKKKIQSLSFTPCLGVILVGDDQASHLYVNLKEKAASEVGIAVEKILLPTETNLATIKNHITNFNNRVDIQAILVQLPLPQNINEQEVIDTIDPTKDADGFHPVNIKKLLNDKNTITPGLIQGICKLLELAKQNLSNKTATLIVNSQEFAQPLIKILENKGIIAKATTKPELEILKKSDIIIVAVGKPNIINSTYIKDGAIVIDVGTNKLNDKIVGDVDAFSLKNRQIYLTPVPGGVGPMTVAMLLWNVYQLATKNTTA